MTGHELLKKLKRLADRLGVRVWFDPVQGSGSHGMLHFAERFTVMKDRKKDIGPGLLASMLRDLGLKKKRSRLNWREPMEHRFHFPVKLTVDEDGFFLATFPDLEGAATDGKTREEAMSEASDCLGAALAFRIKSGLPIPTPSPALGRPTVSPSALMSAKTALYLAWKESGVSCLGLAKKYGMDVKTLQRMLDPKHRTHIGSIETLLKAMGKRIILDLVEAA
jgi:antitoxin HicB